MRTALEICDANVILLGLHYRKQCEIKCSGLSVFAILTKQPNPDRP